MNEFRFDIRGEFLETEVNKVEFIDVVPDKLLELQHHLFHFWLMMKQIEL